MFEPQATTGGTTEADRMTAPHSLFGDLRAPCVVDLFAGGGGASTGIEQATRCPVTMAMNHDDHAIAMHTANHPLTIHYREDVWKVRPEEASRGRKVNLAWFSPDCRHFSRAKGGKPCSKKIRGLAWVVCRWAAKVRPEVIMMENVPEFITWGPLTRRGHPKKKHAGETFTAFIGNLRALGYEVEWRQLVACDYGAPTSRKRLFLIARCDGKPIVWPEPTHGPEGSGLIPWRTAAECIDWSEPMCSIFDTRAEAKSWGERHGRNSPKRPLAPATLARIAEGIRRYVLCALKPFIVNLTHGVRVEDVDEPTKTITGAKRGEKAVVAATLMANNTNNAPGSVTDPLGTITTGHRHYVVESKLVGPSVVGVGGRAGQSPPKSADSPLNTITSKADSALIAPTLINTRNGERKGQTPRVADIQSPLGTVTAHGSQGAMVAALLSQHNGGATGHQTYGRGLDEPMQTTAAKVNRSLTTAHLEKFYGTARGGAPANAPMPTVTANRKGGGHIGVIGASLTNMHGRSVGSELGAPLPTVTEHGHLGLVGGFLTAYYGSEKEGQPLDVPVRTVVSKDRFALVAAFLSKHLGQDFGDCVTIQIDGELWYIADIGMRMLQPRELANAQGFPPDYILTGNHTEQVARIGNSVCPPLARALVAANLGEFCPIEMAA